MVTTSTQADPNVILNAVKYVIKGEISQRKKQQFAPTTRTDGQQRNTGIQSRSSFNFPPPTNGFGLTKILARDVDNPDVARRSKVSELDTRFVPTTLPRLKADTTEPTESGIVFKSLKFSIEFRNELVGFWEAEDANPHGEVWVADYTGSSTAWDNETTIGSTAADPATTAAIPLSGTVDADTLIMLGLFANDHQTFFATDHTGSWTAASTQPTVNQLANNATEGERIDGGGIENISGVGSYLMIWDENNFVVDIFKSTDKAVNWTATATAVASTQNGVHGTAVYFDLNGDVAPVWVTDDAVWAWDTSADVAHKLVALPSSADNGRAITVWANPFLDGRDSLLIGLGDGRTLEYTFISTSIAPRISILDFNINGSLDADMEGHAVRFTTSNQWLFGTYGGNASGDLGWIWAYDGRGSVGDDRSAGFHFITQVATGNRELDWIAISSRDDGSTRLHFQERLTSVTSDTQFILSPLDAPTSPTTINYETSGIMDRPRIDGGMPRDDAAWVSVFSETDDLAATTTDESINLDVGVNGAAPTTNVGDFVSGTRELTTDGSGAGLSGREFQIRETYSRGSTTGNTPKGFGTEVIYSKRPRKVSVDNDNSRTPDIFTFTVDVKRTAEEAAENGITLTNFDVIKNLQAAESTVTYVTLEAATFALSTGTRRVRVELGPYNHDVYSQQLQLDDLDAEVNEILVTCSEL